MAGPVIVQNAAGDRLMLVNKQWVPVAKGAMPGGPHISAQAQSQDEKKMIELQHEAAAAGEVGRQYDRVGKSLHDMHTGPVRGMMLSAATPEPNGGFFDKLGALTAAATGGFLGYVSPKDMTDFQKLRSVQTEQTLQRNTGEKGTQTEGDAARNLLIGVDPLKTEDANDEILAAGRNKIARATSRPSFYAQWGKNYGSLGAPNETGLSVEQAFQQSLDAGGLPSATPKRFKYTNGKLVPQ